MPEQVNQERMLKDVDRYIKRELLSYVILGKPLDDWSREFYENYFKRHECCFRVVIIHIDHSDPDERDLSLISQKLETDFPQLTCKVIREEIVGILIESGKRSLDYQALFDSAAVSYSSNKSGKPLVSTRFSGAATTVSGLTEKYLEFKNQRRPDDDDAILQSKICLDMYALEQDLYEKVLRCDWDGARMTLLAIGETVDTRNKHRHIQNRGYFSHLWRNLDRHIFQMTGKRKTIPVKDNLDSKLENASDISDMISIMTDYAMLYADELELNRQNSTQKIVEKAKEYIELKYYEDVTLENVAIHLGLSGCHLSKMFKKTEGVNFKDYVINVRIHHAKFLLAEGRMNIGEVARHVGYLSANYFSRAFRQCCGVSPLEFSGRFRKPNFDIKTT